ncbi:MAG: hypothetical protein OZSIB_0172 [Candidatus Ozemobacter sibiricus]|uniref:Alpha-2-macroglobulin domain-containing protein n=1 Tax=Candidatus Ozemobacter sibiricus TaxID=2268124 RepID=A0A367ZPL3_9BACT|nr:MAG: hypothetical protein OZSIB_0172 [Candidatus Ozemobacter sibiricus]
MKRFMGCLMIVAVAAWFFPLWAAPGQTGGETQGIFQVDPEKSEILDLAPGLADRFRLQFVSVTVDQPTFWPNEDVHLKVAMPARPMDKIKVTLARKNAAPRDLGEFRLNDGGLLLETIMSGAKKPLEVGEYRVEVKTADGAFKGDATFAVIEGSLGAVSFAYEFQQLTSPQALEEARAGWFLGNAAGVGARWGNGLNVKNELRVFNQPFNGPVTLKTRCLLPGCDGCEAGPSQQLTMKKGELAAVLQVGGHSGPFELEVITEKGNVRHLFGRSGHVERQVSLISSGFTNRFKATVAPYENTVAVPGRDIYLLKEEGQADAPFALDSALTGDDGAGRITARVDLEGVKAWRLVPKADGRFAVEPLSMSGRLKKGDEVTFAVAGPYSFVAIGGWETRIGEEKKPEKILHQAWAMLFTPSALRVKLETPKQAAPEREITVTIDTFDRASGKPRSVWGMLEVFDNRVANRSPKDPLISATGDSFRDAAAGLSQWEDQTGYRHQIRKGKRLSLPQPGVQAAPSPSMMMSDEAFSGQATALDIEMEKSAPAPAMARSLGGAAAMAGAPGGAAEEAPPAAENPEVIRVGEKKVVCCQLVKTDAAGRARVTVKLPPQSGRCKARFVALSGFDWLEAINDVDVGRRGGTVELSAPALLLKGAQVSLRAFATCEGGAGQLKVSGAGLARPLTFAVPAGGQEFQVPLVGTGGSGELLAELTKADGTLIDRRAIPLRDASEFPVTFSELIVSEGKPITVPAKHAVSVFAHPGQLLRGMTMTIVTTMKSWFGHSEALSAMAAIDAMLLRSFAEGLLEDDGLRSTIKADLDKAIKDLDETFYDRQTRLMRPYPGLDGTPLWSVWVLKNLLQVTNTLSGHAALKAEFATLLDRAGRLAEELTTELGRRKISTEEVGLFTPGATDGDLIPVVVDGKVVHRAVTDAAVVNWFVKEMAPALDLGGSSDLRDLNERFVKNYDKFRFLRAFERTGPLYYLLLNAKALYLQKDPSFDRLFRTIARGMILTGEPGLVQGPAMLGGVYGAPQTVVKFLDLLITMAREKAGQPAGQVVVDIEGQPRATHSLGATPIRFTTEQTSARLTMPSHAIALIERSQPLLMSEYLTTAGFFRVRTDATTLSVGEARTLTIDLDQSRDPIEYYAVIALPSVVTLRQTEDILADYRGQLLYGQKASGGERIQFLTVPFRGRHTLSLVIEGALPGRSHGFVMVRHQGNPAIIQTLEIPAITCR